MRASQPTAKVATTSVRLDMALCRPICFMSGLPAKVSESRPVENGTRMPAPIPSVQLNMMSASMEVESIYPTVDPANISSAATISIFLWLVVESLPDISTKGIMRRLGSIVSSCFSRALDLGKI